MSHRSTAPLPAARRGPLPGVRHGAPRGDRNGALLKGVAALGTLALAGAAALVATALSAPATAAERAAADATAADTLAQLADAQGKDIGFALTANYLNETSYRNIADTEFNYVVAENAMKWDATEPQQNQFTFGAGDEVAQYAAASGKGLYGHTLVWHAQAPGWAQSLSGAALEGAMTNHITNVVDHYSGQVEAWDVVNEAFNDDGSRRSSFLQNGLGNGWIETAFRAARAADPDVKLCINDYSVEAINAKSTAIYDLVADFKQRGVPIDCVGLQSHLIVGQVPSSFQQNLERFAALGVDVRITELDIRMSTPASSGDLQQQANDYGTVFRACLAVQACQGVTIWGITDRYSWVPGTFPGQGAALVWDENYAPKPAYGAIYTALGGA
jgi:endo-1,4-beta-xylanase